MRLAAQCTLCSFILLSRCVDDHFSLRLFLFLVTEMLVNVLNLKGGDDEDLDSDEEETAAPEQSTFVIFVFCMQLNVRALLLVPLLPAMYHGICTMCDVEFYCIFPFFA